jgi:hypothetical protein
MKARRLFLALVMGLLFALGSLSTVLAGPPDISEVAIDATIPAGRAAQTCGFPVSVHREGTIRFIVRYDQNGNPIKEVQIFHVEDTFFRTDVQNAPEISGIERSVQQITYNPDGSMLIMSAGADRWVVQPGGGAVWGTAGSAFTYVSPTGDFTDIRESGANADFSLA